jgi:hypothetical protein
MEKTVEVPKFDVTVVHPVSEELAGVTLTNPPEADARATILVRFSFAGWYIVEALDAFKYP